MQKKGKIAPSILAADFSRLGEQVQLVKDAGAEVIHIDVMDGHFVPNISIGPPVITSLRKATDLPFDVHLMIENPGKYIDAFADAGADNITVHLETCPDLPHVIEQIKNKNIDASVSIKPSTPVSSLDRTYLRDLHMVLIMSVDPGFGGQEFIPNTLNKLKGMRDILEKRELNDVYLEVDGGITIENIREVAEAGAEIFVCGSSIFRAPDPEEAFKQMKKIVESNI